MATRDESSPAPTWAILQEAQDTSGDSEGEDELNHEYDPPGNRPKLPLPSRAKLNNSMKRNRENEISGNTAGRPQKRLRQSVNTNRPGTGLVSAGSRKGSLNGSFSAGPSKLREQIGPLVAASAPPTSQKPSEQIEPRLAASRSAKPPLGRSATESHLPGSSSSIITPRVSLPTLPSQAPARNGLRAGLSKTKRQFVSDSESGEEEDSSSKAKTSSSEAEPSPRQRLHQVARKSTGSSKPPRKDSGSGPRPEDDVIEISSDGDDELPTAPSSSSVQPSARSRITQWARKSSGRGKPPRANGIASTSTWASRTAQKSSLSAFKSPTKPSWTDFADNISAGYSRGDESGTSSRPTSPSKPVSSSKPVSPSKPGPSSKLVSSTKPGSSSKPVSPSKPGPSSKPLSSSKPASPSKPPSSKITDSTLDGFVINNGKAASRRGSEPSTGDESVDRRPLEEALGLDEEEPISARRTSTPKGKKVAKASGSKSRNFLPVGSNDLASTIQAAGEQNSRLAAARRRSGKAAAPHRPPSLPADSAIGLGSSVDNAIDLTALSDDDVSAPPPPVASTPRRRCSKATFPKPASATAAIDSDNSDPEVGSIVDHRRASRSGPSRPATPALQTAHRAGFESSPALAKKTDANLPVRKPALPNSPVRRHTIPTAATETAASEVINAPSVTSIATPRPVRKGPSMSPPASVISIHSSNSSRATSPRPMGPFPQLPSRPPVSRSRTNATIPITATISEPTNFEVPILDHTPENISLDRQFDDDVGATSASDADAAMEVDAILVPAREVSSELDSLAAALGSQNLKTSSASEKDDLNASRETSASRPQSHRLSPEVAAVSDDFYASDEAENDNALVSNQGIATPRGSSASASSSADSEPLPTPADLPVTPAFPGAKTYGGIKALTFDSWRQQFNPKVYYTKDLRSNLHDQINNCSERFRMCKDIRQVLTGEMSFNTMEDEPNAPPIQIINTVDHEPTPPWEFYYTNRIYHGPGVPDPNVATLIGCDCVGKCDPKSKTCRCVQRQKDLIPFPEDNRDAYNSGFLYDKHRRLKHKDYPIVECNALCGCDAECMNRVVQHGRTVAVTIQKTEKKGWGVFAGPKKIPSGTFLGIYSGELITVEESDERGKYYNSYGKTYLFDLDFYFIPNKDEDGDPAVQYTMDAYHAGNFTRFLNHSCEPNCRIFGCYINEANLGKPLLVVFAIRDIEPNEEICFSYVGDGDDGSDEGAQKDGAVYTACQCGAPSCSGKMFK